MILRLGNQGQVREQTVIATNERRQSNGGGRVVLNRMGISHLHEMEASNQ